MDHLESVALVCSNFLSILHQEKCSKDIRSRLWSSQIQDTLKARQEAAVRELDLIIEDVKSYPINYNHYYIDTVSKQRQARGAKPLTECIEGATQRIKLEDCRSNHLSTKIDVDRAVESYSKRMNPNMEKHSCQEALDCLFSIYKVCCLPALFNPS